MSADEDPSSPWWAPTPAVEPMKFHDGYQPKAHASVSLQAPVKPSDFRELDPKNRIVALARSLAQALKSSR